MELREVVKHLLKVGVELEVLTTCVKEFTADWNTDYYQPGLTIEAGVPVRRFRVRKRDTPLYDSINLKLMNGEHIPRKEQEIFAREMINSPDLYSYIKNNKDEYGLFVFIPYMFGPIYHGCQIAPEKSVMIPCLHDEAYAYMDIFKETFPKIAGMIFNSEPERKLAERLYGVSGDSFVTFGIGLDTDFTCDAERFRKKYKIHEPFILYAGRKDAGKRVDVLVENFMAYKKRNHDDLKLVLIGGGKIDIPEHDVYDLGFVSAQDKYDAYAAASIFCNPSQFESFSLVIMESWLAETPVLVNGDCEVTRDFATRFAGGLYYQNCWEFEECVQYLLTHSDIAAAMGRNGRQAVLQSFAWDVIVQKYIKYFEDISERTRA